MRFPSGTDVARLRLCEKTYSKVYLGVQRGKERGEWSAGTLVVGQHYRLTATDVYDATAQGWHTITFAAGFLNGSDIRPNMTLACGTLANPFLYGSARIRRVDAANNRLCLEMNNLNAFGYFATGDYIWVDGVYRLYRILPRIIDGVIHEDGNWDDTSTNNGIPGEGIIWNRRYYYRPVALMGSPRFAWAGEPINFYGWRSHARGGRRINYHTWDFDGGACLGPGLNYAGSPSNPIQVRWSAAGEYIASLVVEDNSNHTGLDAYGVRFDRHRAVRPVLVYDRPGAGDNPPYTDFEVESLAGRYGSGWSCRITVYGTADASEFPDNALIILFAEDWYGGVRGSIGGWYGQEGILFVGHVRADSVTVDSEQSTVSFEAQTIEQWMKDITVWPANFEAPLGGGSNAWHEYNNMTIEDILWHLAEVHSTLKNVADCFFASDVGIEKQVHFLDLTEASLYDQMSSQIGSCFFGQLSASRHGSVHLCKHKNMMDLAERIWWGPPVYSFSKQDWRDELEIGEERMRDSVAQVDMIGFVYDLNGNPLDCYSLAPTRQTNFGRIEKVTGVLLTGNAVGGVNPAQLENNANAGLNLAWKNIRFPHISVPARNNRVLEPAEQDYFAVVLAASDTERGYVWAGKEFLTVGASVEVDNEKGTILATIEGEASTWGPDGVAGEYPYDPPASNPPTGNPPGFWPDWDWDTDDGNDPPPWAEEGEGPVWPITAYMGLTSGHVIRVVGVGPSVRWGNRCAFHNCGQVDAGGISWMALDQFDPVNTAMVCTGSRIWKTTNLLADTPDWEIVLNVAAPATQMDMVRSSPVQQDLWMVAGYGGADAVVWWTTTGGPPWNVASFGTDPDGAWQVFLEMSAHDADRAWVVWVDNTDKRTYVATTNDMWATAPTLTFIPTTCFSGRLARPCCHHRIYDNSDDSARIYGGYLMEDGGGIDYARVYVSPNCANLYTDVGQTSNMWVPMVGCGIGTRNRWWATARGISEQGFWASDDGTAWVEQADWDFEAGGDRWTRDCKNLRGDWRWYLAGMDGTSYPLTLSIDRGVTWYPQPGGVGGGLGWAAFITAEGLAANPDVNVVCPVEAPR